VEGTVEELAASYGLDLDAKGVEDWEDGEGESSDEDQEEED
jgi:hypothetical protein